MDLDEVWLQEACNTGEGPYLRPFQPNPNWRSAQVFLVGTNPATPLRTEFSSFADYWVALTDRPEHFYSRYQTKHAKGESKTSARARRFLEHVRPINCLVTNAFAYPARRASEIPGRRVQQQIGLEVFERLLRLARPAVALFHGAEALQLAQTYFGTPLDPYTPLNSQEFAAPAPGTGQRIRCTLTPTSQDKVCARGSGSE